MPYSSLIIHILFMTDHLVKILTVSIIRRFENKCQSGFCLFENTSKSLFKQTITYKYTKK